MCFRSTVGTRRVSAVMLSGAASQLRGSRSIMTFVAAVICLGTAGTWLRVEHQTHARQVSSSECDGASMWRRTTQITGTSLTPSCAFWGKKVTSQNAWRGCVATGPSFVCVCLAVGDGGDAGSQALLHARAACATGCQHMHECSMPDQYCAQ